MSKARQLADLGNQVDDGAISGTNMVINGAMNVAQRSSSVTGNGSSGYLTCDRWKVSGGMGTRTVTQQADAPEGFYNSYKIEITTAETSPSAGTSLAFEQRMEGQNLQMLKKGTSNALPITISFWVKSNKTGTYILEIDDNDNSRNINKSYTVSSSGVWEYKTITFEGDTTGSLDNDNAHSLRLFFWLDAGSNFRGGTLATSWENTTNANRADGNVTFADTVGNTWQITGVCLNVGDSAIDFPHDESYGDTLAKCQRYYQRWNRSAGGSSYLSLAYFRTTTDWRLSLPLPTPLRTQETSDLTLAVNDISDFKLLVRGTSVTSTSIHLSYGTADILSINGTVSSGLTQGEVGQLRLEQSDTFLEIDAEL